MTQAIGERLTSDLVSEDRAVAADQVAIRAENVSKSYQKVSLLRRKPKEPPTWALRDVSFDIMPGEMVGLLGPNGAGKTTLLKILTNLLYPSEGRVLYFGKDLRTHQTQVRRMCGLVTCDERSFYWRLSGRHNLKFFATLYGLSPESATARIDLLLETLGLTYAADREYASYSSGMKQKLAIARGLLADPKIVFYDEPTRSLDPLSCLTIRQWIKQTRKDHPDRTHLLATNQLDEAEMLCDRVIIINRGQMIARGSIADVRRQFDEREYEVRHLTIQGDVPLPVADEDLGLLEIEEESTAGDARRIRLRTRKSSHAYSWVVERLLQQGAVLLDSETEKVAFDEVFCSLVLGTQATPSLRTEVTS